ncbi:isoprenylcysteine carboxylmethyltransferase family protein [Nocardia sp. NBC_01499]|uniref:methyltransferase family protein n=1 Tax=Nocardia sp. NBC_01499 TaxID=2903597 RepID=UPI003867E713
MFPIATPAATVLFWTAVACWQLAELVVFLRGNSVRAPGSRHDHGSVWLVLGSGLLGFVLIVSTPFVVPWARLSGGWVLFAAGIALVFLGIALRLWAVRSLGQFFQPVVTIQSAHRLVTKGPYRAVRHPAYTGALLTLAGFGLAVGNGVALAAAILVPVVGFLPRIVLEERALLQAFGSDYVSYRKRSAHLVPGVW